MTNRRQWFLVVLVSAAGFMGGLLIYEYRPFPSRAVPTHIEADNYRYLDPHMGDVPAAQPSLPSTPPCGGSVPCNQVLAAQSPVDGGAYIYDGKKWRKVPVVQGDCTILKSGAMECCGGPGRPPCDDGPGPMQGWWMDTDRLQQDDCTGKSLKDENCEGSGTIDESVQTAPPAVLKGPPTQVCVYNFVGSPYLRLNKAVSDPSCADFGSPDDNSEELEQDDYNNEITEGSQI